MIGISLISISLVIGDFISAKKSNRKSHLNIFEANTFPLQGPLQIMFLSLTILVPIGIFIVAGDIPFLELIRERGYGEKVSESRANFTKYETPYLLNVLGNWVVNLFAPFLIVSHILTAKYIRAAALFFWSFFFALSSGAQSPSAFLLLTIIFTTLWLKPALFNQTIKIVSLALISLFLISSITFGNKIVKVSGECSVPNGIAASPANLLRACPELSDSNYLRERLSYRLFYVPVEVSNAWYQEFDNELGNSRNFFEIFSRTEVSKYANQIGLKYYVANFPDSYRPYITAYGSIDADAFSIGGLAGVSMVALAILIIRILLSSSIQLLACRILCGLGIVLLSTMSTSASLQAILFSQGLGVIISLILTIIFLNARTSSRS